ncbi:TonB-dependent receptor [Oleiagrimonas soli]|uniref:Outer membrane receptor protein involved in Fe transport n=1 Tax=Oleiagrimonas soli TaxID=1543381 RepID=A0A099CYL3_9GAMM|nr:TonB-dependent receptor [Oleiagrimonas soli]KGI79043.1 hypothetical protein LF63_0101475 [Oleiagrimonas soli]MBB6184591.1 outer membrane receptor protein involved in Fe transport [Oleiagrimonas soli]
MRRRNLEIALCAALSTLACAAHADPPTQQLHEVVVVGVAPLPGFEVPRLQIPLNVQSAQADDIEQLHGQSVTQLLQRNFQGVNVTQSQGNPWSGNLYFHGFTLSPLLGSPAGISVYVDGVRQNEPFAETMNWDAVPDFAIRNVQLVPGSNPLYGLNTLGGALLLNTKSGFTDPGGSVHLSGGSWGRIQTDADVGVHGKTWALYAGAASSDETGWRAHSPSRVQQLYLRGDWQPNEDTTLTLSYTGAHSRLFGTQTIPVAWADTPKTAYTWPDYAIGNLNQLNLQGMRQLDTDWSLQANAYLRLSKTRGFDSNTNDRDAYDAAEDGPLGYDPAGPYDPDSLGQFYYAGVSPAYDPSDPAATINNVPASNVINRVDTRGFGTSVQAVNTGELAGRDNRFTVGASLDAGNTRFSMYGQPAYFPLDPARRGETIGLLPFALGPLTRAATGNRSVGVYAMDVLTLTPTVHLSAGGRYNLNRLSVHDLTGRHPEIDGRQSFRRFNPTLGATWAISPRLDAYLNYGEGMRAPTPIEFECADPDAPCSLPNDFTGDPPLKAVVVRTLSGGLRGLLGGTLHWNLSPYYSRVDDDILTIYTSGGSEGYFANVPRTVRKGVDIGVGGQSGRLEWQFNYSYVRATYGAAFETQSADNSSADGDGVIRVRRGDRLPGVPRQMLNVSTEFHFDPRWSAGANLRAYAAQYAIGDENNADRHGPVPGYAVVDLDLHYRPTPRLAFFARVDNAFDRRYAISGQLSRNVFDTPGRLIDLTGPGTSMPFIAPGAPRSVLVGVSYAFGPRTQADDD